MKKIIWILVLCVVFLTACSGKSVLPDESSNTVPSGTADTEPVPSSSEVLVLKVSDYFPFTKDVHMKYKGTGNEYAAYETYIDYVKADVMQVRQMNGGTTSAIVYRLSDGALKKVYSQGEVYYRYDYTSLSNQDEILIKEPIKEGTSWTLKDGASRSITAVDKQIKTPAGDFSALEITTKRQDSTQKDYYVKNIGHVKAEFMSGGDSSTIVSELEKVENDVPFTHRVRFYFPEFLKDRVAYIDRDVEINTNQDMKFKFQKELKTVPENGGLSKTLTTNTSILGCKIDEKNGTVTVDLTSQFIKEMNAGTSLESMLIKSITNTIGDYYQKDKVIITIEGKLYESGHVLLKQGEYFTVSKDNVAEYGK